mmetsp:Transcript_93/g.165  ORF Transcript_93/g.165 Transcript_93/m.165 type:complete len:132 (+) Transcript_93:1370-1765(+)
MGRRHWHVQVVGNLKNNGCGNQGAQHTIHEDFRFIRVIVSVDDLVSDRVGNTGTQQHRSSKLANSCDHNSLPKGNRLGGHRSGKGVGAIISTDSEGVPEAKNWRCHGHPVILRKSRHLEELLNATLLIRIC